MLDISKVVWEFAKEIRIPDASREQFRTILRKLKDHPDFGFWYLYNEPEPHKIFPEDLRVFHRLAKRETLDIPPPIAVAWAKQWYKFLNFADIIMSVLYLV